MSRVWRSRRTDMLGVSAVLGWHVYFKYCISAINFHNVHLYSSVRLLVAAKVPFSSILVSVRGPAW